MSELDRILAEYRGSTPFKTFSNLQEARTNGNGHTGQEDLAPAEHHAFNRVFMGRNPHLYATGALAPPLYALRKALWRREGETPPSMDQVMGAWKGGFKGLLDAYLED